MKINFKVLFSALATFTLAGCAMTANTPVDQKGQGQQTGDSLQVVVTFSILEDITREIGGDLVDIHSIVPIGTDPHEYQPLPEDISKTADTDVIIWNGLNLELGDGWFENILDITGHSFIDSNVIEASSGVEPKYLSDGAGGEHEVNPHAFLDPNVGIAYAENIAEGLASASPEHGEEFSERASLYISKLEDIHSKYEAQLSLIPEEKRTLVTSENAFQYLNDRYGIKGLYIWAIDTGDLGSPEQISGLIEELKTSMVPGLFVESNVDKRPMETVSEESGIPIVGTLFSDELGKAGGDGATYIGMLNHNLETIIAGLNHE